MKKAEPATTISIRFPNSLLQAVRNIADAQDRSVTYVTVRAVKAWLAPVPALQPTAAQPTPSPVAIRSEPAPMPVQASGQPVATTKAEAKRLGLTRFFNSRPCIRGHIGPRNLNGNCVDCTRVLNATRIKAKAAV